MADQPLAFHSDNIHSTKAHEKREVFVKVEEKKTFKQTAEEFQKKFAAAKAHAAESRAKIENPGADANGVIRSHTRRPFPWKKIVKYTIILAFIGGLAYAGYTYYPKIAYQFMPSEQKGMEILKNNPEEGIKYLRELANKAPSKEENARILIDLAYGLFEYGGDSYSADIHEIVYEAENVYSSPDSASAIYAYESTYGTAEEAARWQTIVSERGGVIGGGNG